jgi:superfamily II DNA or RNA helicase
MARQNGRQAAGAGTGAAAKKVGRDVPRATRAQAVKARSATKTSNELTFHDRLSRLTPQQAALLLGEHGNRLMARGAQREIRLKEDVYLGGDLFRVTFPGANRRRPEAIVTVTAMTTARDRLHWNCTACSAPCEHVGAAFSFLLEEKTSLGLAVAPPKDDSAPPATEEELIAQALADRVERARVEKMKVATADATTPWTDYTVTSALSGKTYRVALRGVERGQSYCSCPDFRTNTLGTCKHILHTLEKTRKKFTAAQIKKPYRRTTFSVAVHYGTDLELRLLMPEKLDDETAAIAGKLRGQPVDDVHDLLKRMRHLERLGQRVHIYPDAEEFIQQKLFQEQTAERMTEIRRDPESHPLRTSLLKTELLPYQLDGIAFAVSAGRAVLADEMGLGKTIQGVGAAELFAREADIKRVLVVCPTSLKSQWRNEIQRFSDRTVQIVAGPNAERGPQYASDAFFTICNYEQVLKDILHIERTEWDLIILDEGQRIKNWEAKTSRVIKGLRSRFALVLSGTPLENRLDELYSVVQFIDDRRLGPGFRFFHQHRVVDERGKVLGFKNLAALRENLKPVLLRRTRDSVQQQLPPRTNEIIRIPPTQEQAEMSAAHLQNVRRITGKKFLTEMDLLMLQKELLLCRMTADSTFLVDKKGPGFSTKLAALDELFERLFDEEGRKAILFSEWTTMLNLIEPLLKKRKLPFVRLDGSVPQKQRQAIVHEFQNNPDCKLFLTSNAGSTGLNLQSANTVINVDLPWNPAVLEQRVARAYRMGQKRPVDVYILVTEDTLEEKLLATLAAKQDLALAALDAESDVDEVRLESGMEELKRRLEVLLGARAEGHLDESGRREAAHDAREITTAEAPEADGSAHDSDDRSVSDASASNSGTGFDSSTEAGGFAIPDGAASTEQDARRERVSTAGGQLLAGAVALLGELLPSRPETDASRQLAETLKQGLSDCVQQNERGQAKLTFTLPDASVLNVLADSLAKLLTR